MAKAIIEGLAQPDEPMFSEGCTVFSVAKSTPSTTQPGSATNGTPANHSPRVKKALRPSVFTPEEQEALSRELMGEQPEEYFLASE